MLSINAALEDSSDAEDPPAKRDESSKESRRTALAKTLELAKPHWEKAVAALRPKIEAAIEYLERAFSALGGEK